MRPSCATLLILLLLAPIPGTFALQGPAVLSTPRQGRYEADSAQPTAFMRGVQRELKRAGYDPGIQDGMIGPATRDALRRFQEDQGLPVTGEPDVPTLTRLLQHSLRR